MHTQFNATTRSKYFETNLRFEDSKDKQDDKEKEIDCYHSHVVNISFCVVILNTTFCKTKEKKTLNCKGSFSSHDHKV